MRHAARLLLALCPIAPLATAALGADTVTLRPSVRVAHGTTVVLGDVASIDGEGADKLAAVAVGSAGAGAFELDAPAVRRAIAAAGLDAASVRIEGARSVVRPARGRTAEVAAALASRPALAPRVAKPVVREQIEAIDPAQHAGASTPLGIVCTIVANAFHDEAKGALRLEIAADDLAQLAPVAGRRYEIVAKSALRADRVDFEVVSYEGTAVVSRERVRVLPRVAREVAVAGADTRRGSALDNACLRIERRHLAPSAAARTARPSELAGATLAGTVTEGSVIEADDVARELAVRRNERVMIRREIGMIAVELEAVALEDGSAGDIIAFETRGRERGRDARAVTAEVVGRGRAVIR